MNKLIYASNCTRHSVTSFSLYYLLFGRNLRLPTDVMPNTFDVNNYVAPDYQKNTKEWSERMEEALKIASENTKNKRAADKIIKRQESDISAFGDWWKSTCKKLVGERGTRKSSFVLGT